MRNYDLSCARHHQAHIKGSIRRRTVRTGHHAIRYRGRETNCNAASATFQPPVGGGVAPESYCDPRKIHPGSVSTPDESDRLSRQDREAPGCPGDDAKLEYHREDRKTSSQHIACAEVLLKLPRNENEPNRSVQRRRHGHSHYDYGPGVESTARSNAC